MRRTTGLILFFILLSLACWTVIPATPTPLPSQTTTPTATRILTNQLPTPSATPTPEIPQFEIRAHPDDGLYVGDIVSLEVVVPDDLNLEGQKLQVQVGDDFLGAAEFSEFGIGNRYQATLPWMWNTTGFEAGAYALDFSLNPTGITWAYTLTLQAEAQLPWPEPLAQWANQETDCCLIYYITHTAVERDLKQLLDLTDAQADHAMNMLNVAFTEPIEITLVPRVVGQGGFARGDIYISYLDRNYIGNNFETVLHHEMIHILDGELADSWRPAILVEGLAVYLTGGHYKIGPLLPQAAALLPPTNGEPGLDWYLPLNTLSDDFYLSQHEIGYIQASALVAFMVNTWGWEAFSDFYWNLVLEPGETQSQALDAGLRMNFGITLSQLEEQFISALKQETVTENLYNDVRLMVEIYEAARRYQQILDPSAYFLSAWLPDGREMRQRKILADLLRHPSKPENVALETLLVSANQSWQVGDYKTAQNALDALGAVLDAIEAQDEAPFSSHPLAWDYFAIANQLGEAGYQVQRIWVGGDSGQAWVTMNNVDLVVVEIQKNGKNWEITSNRP